MKPIARRLILIAIPLLLIFSVIFIMIYLAYKAETEGVRLGPPKISIQSDKPEKNEKAGRPEYKPGEYKNNKINRGSGDSGEASEKKSVSKQDKPSDYGFAELEDSFLPSTREYNALKPRDKTSGTNSQKTEEDFNVKLTGDLAKEMFIFGVFNSIKDGMITREGGYFFKPQGKDTGKNVFVEFRYSVKNIKAAMQLPVLLNGEVKGIDSPQALYTIDPKGIFRAKKVRDTPIDVIYSISRRDKNSELLISAPVSPWLAREFKYLPYEIKNFLNGAKKSPEEIRTIFAATCMNKCFGYQKDILPVDLAPGTTWAEYLQKYISIDMRFLADCDVLSTYAFIFLRYLDVKCVIALGYANTDTEKMSTLTRDKHHAVLLIKINGEWLVFDPSAVVPDMSGEAMELAKVTPVPQPDRMEEKAKSHENKGITLVSEAAREFEIPFEVVEIMGGIMTASRGGAKKVYYEPKENIDFGALASSAREILSFYKENLEVSGQNYILPSAALLILLFLSAALGLLQAWPVYLIVHLVKMILG